MKSIDIPKPCSEDWNEMSPTEKGAFCQKCAIDVYDFTNKSGDEIRDILTLNIGSRVCGRIQPKQLDELNDDFHAWQLSNKQSFNRAWILSLIVVFGLTLFSCEEDEEPVVKEIQKTASAFLDSFPEHSVIDEAIELNQKNEIEKTEIKDSFNSDTLELTVDLEDISVVAEVSPYDEYTVGIVDQVEAEDLEEVPIRGAIEYSTVMLGAMVMVEPLGEDVVSTEIGSCEPKLSGIVYPNPAQNQTTLKVEMPQFGTAEILLFSMTGEQLRTIHSGRMQEGENEFPMDVSNLDVGTYLVVIISEGKKETVKFSKI
jgi:hypothetical protein